MRISVRHFICVSLGAIVWLGVSSRASADSAKPDFAKPGLLDDAFVDPMDSTAVPGSAPQRQLDNQPTDVAPIAVPTPRAWEMGAVGLLIVAGIGAKKPRWIFN